MTRANLRVPGHTLRYEGQPFGPDGRKTMYSVVGSGKCSCGELSPPLESNNARKRWHAEHKAAVIGGDA